MELMGQGSRRRMMALHALLVMSAIQAITPDARDMASSALLKLFSLNCQPGQRTFNDRDHSEDVCQEARIDVLSARAVAVENSGLGRLESRILPMTAHDRGDDARSTWETAGPSLMLRSLCRLLC
jgi:hypothetical protein